MTVINHDTGEITEPLARVYYLYGATDVLYIGCTTNLPRRIKEHHRKPWWGEVARATATGWMPLAEAMEHEAAEIASRWPAYNQQHAPALDPMSRLPLAHTIAGRAVPAELLSVGEYARVIADRYAVWQRTGFNAIEHRRVSQYQEACHATHGVWLDAADCYAQYREAS